MDTLTLVVFALKENANKSETTEKTFFIPTVHIFKVSNFNKMHRNVTDIYDSCPKNVMYNGIINVKAVNEAKKMCKPSCSVFR